MVDAVHIGGDDEQPEQAVEPHPQADVPMAEHRGPVQQDLEDDNRQGGNAEGRHRRKFDQRGEEDLQGVKPQPRGDVYVEIGVVHTVEAPEEGERVKQHMLEVDDQVEQQDADQDRRPEWHGQMVQGPPPAGGSEQGETDGEDGCQEARHTSIDQRYGEIDPPAGGLTRGERTAGRTDLGEGDEDEDREEGAEPDRGFVGKIVDRLIWWNHGWEPQD